MAARGRQGRSLAAAIVGLDGLDPRECMEQARAEGWRHWRQGVTYWRQVLTVSAAAQRARAGNRTAARRLAWRDLVLEGRRRARWLVSQYRVHEAGLARLLREQPAAECVACARRQAGSRRLRDEYLADIAKLPQSVLPYAAYRHRAEAAAGAARWLPGWSESTTTPEDTLREAGIPSARQAAYQRKMSMLLGQGTEDGDGHDGD